MQAYEEASKAWRHWRLANSRSRVVQPKEKRLDPHCRFQTGASSRAVSSLLLVRVDRSGHMPSSEEEESQLML